MYDHTKVTLHRDDVDALLRALDTELEGITDKATRQHLLAVETTLRRAAHRIDLATERAQKASDEYNRTHTTLDRSKYATPEIGI